MNANVEPLDIEELMPDDQQESEEDLSGDISFKDAVVMNTDWTIETINSQISKKNVKLDPVFQRRAAWDEVRKSRLIESIIVGMPIPNVVLAENRDSRGQFIVIDGKQRLLSIQEFASDKLNLRHLDIRKDLNGRSYETLPAEDRQYFENSTLRATIIKNWHDEQFLYSIFYRLNSGSLPLSPQELRKALVGGKLLDEIENYLQKSSTFKKVFGDGLDRRMRDSELVLRFIAFDRFSGDYKGNLKQFLDDTVKYYEKEWDNERGDVSQRVARLDCALECAYSIFGISTFKKWTGNGYEKRMNRALFDCVTRFFAEASIAAESKAKGADVVGAFKNVCENQHFREAIEKTTKSLNATKNRVDIWGEALGKVLGRNYRKETWRLE